MESVIFLASLEARKKKRKKAAFFTTNEARKITDSISCHSKNLIYLIEGTKCRPESRENKGTEREAPGPALGICQLH